jgi:hypothetical protein
MLGDHRGDLGQLDDLAGREGVGGVGAELVPAALATGGPVVDDLVRSGRHLQPLALGAQLLASAALRPSFGLRPSRALLGLALALGGGVR